MFVLSVAISLVGLLILYTVSADLFIHQVWAVGLGIFLYGIVRRFDRMTLQHLWWIAYIGTIILLFVSLFAPEVRGSHRWIDFFGISIQPSEIVKPLFIVSLAGFLSRQMHYNLWTFFIYTLFSIVPFYLIFKQPDLGNTIVYFFMYIALLFVSRFPLKYYAVPIVTVGIGGPLAWPLLADYQKLRIITFLNPEYDIQGAGYNAYQSLIAVGSGGLFGKGLGAGTQSSLSFLPEYHTDFIFATAVEQIGLMGGLLIICMYAALLFCVLLHIREDSQFNRLVVWGVFAQLLAQIFVNIGMNIGIVPITGITLPLLSFGGSSIVATFVSLGLLSSFRKKNDRVIAIR